MKLCDSVGALEYNFDFVAGFIRLVDKESCEFRFSFFGESGNRPKGRYQFI